MDHKLFRLCFVLTLTIGLAVIPAPQPVRAAGPWYVSTAGTDANDCMSPTTPCATIDGAIGKAADGDTINVATGTYTGSASYVVTIAKSLTLSGGWDATFTTNNGVSTIDGQNARGGVSTAYYEYVFATMDRFVIQNGRTTQGGGIFAYYDTVTLNNSTVINNLSTENGGGLLIIGVLTLNNSTISGNNATGTGGGIWFFNQSGAPLTLNNSTIANNSASQGGGLIINFYGSPQPTAILQNSIVANNTATTGPDCFGIINISDHNIVSNTSDCTVTAGPGDQFNVNPLISAYPLGTSAYHTLLAGGPAIDAGDPTTCLSTDQRGVSRPQGVACDIGAYEYTTPGTATSFGISAGSNQRISMGSPLPIPFVVYVVDNLGTPVSDTMVTFTAPASGPSGTFADTGTNTTTAVSNGSGLAIASVFTANNQDGNFDVTATAAGLSGLATFVLGGFWYVAPIGADSNTCASVAAPCLTINAAIGKAAWEDTIKVAIGMYTSTGGVVVQIEKSLTLSGGWDASFANQSGISIIDAQFARQGVAVSSNTSSSIDHFAIQNGSSYQGGGLYNHGTLTLNNTVVKDSISSSYGGGIDNEGILTLNNSAVINNRSDSEAGGGILNRHTNSLTINNSTISGNRALYGGGIINVGTLLINNSTITNNTATQYEGGGLNMNSGTSVLQNTIIAGNIANSAPDCSGTVGSLGYNLIGNTSGCTFASSTGDLTNLDPNLGQLIGPPGAPRYHPLFSGSPAIDAGNPAGCTDQNSNLLTSDQRGVARVGSCDIGSYEYTTPGSAISLSVAGADNQITATTLAFPNPLQAAALDSQGSPVSGVTIDFTAPASGASGTFADTGTNTTSANTNADGFATTSTFTANDQAGAYPVSASATGLGSVNFYLEQVDRPGNDNFAEAEVFTSLPFTSIVDITNATNEQPNEPQNCDSMDRTVWYSFTPTESMVVVANSADGAIYTNVNIYRAGSGISDLQFLSCTGAAAFTTFIAEANQTYYLQAGSSFGEVGYIRIDLEQFPPPVNDNFAAATPVSSLPSTIDFDTTGATFESNEPPTCGYPSPPYKTIWFAFTASQDGSISASIPGSSFTPFLAIYSGTGFNNLTQLGCGQYSNKVTFHVVQSQTYYLQVGGYYGEGGTGTFLLENAPAPQANFYFYPGDPSKYDTIQFCSSSNDPGNVGIESFTWDFGDGATSTEGCSNHRYAADGDYTVQHTVTTFDGRTAAATPQVVQVRTHDVAITKITTPNSANVGQTRSITVNLRNIAYPETVLVELYKSTPNGFVWVATVTKSVAVFAGNRTTAVNFSYTFTSDDAKIGKVTFKAFATIIGARDAWPSDNEKISLITKIVR